MQSLIRTNSPSSRLPHRAQGLRSARQNSELWVNAALAPIQRYEDTTSEASGEAQHQEDAQAVRICVQISVNPVQLHKRLITQRCFELSKDVKHLAVYELGKSATARVHLFLCNVALHEPEEVIDRLPRTRRHMKRNPQQLVSSVSGYSF